MDLILYVLVVFIFGVMFGSFLCVCIDRLPKGLSVIKGHSMCDHCGKTLGPKHLIPIVSYLALSGKCSFCNAKIPPHVLIIETLGGVIAVLVFAYSMWVGLGIFAFILLAIVAFSLLGIFTADLRSGIIPDEFLVVMGIASFILVFVLGDNIILNLSAGLVSFLLFYILYAVTKGAGMGFGDVKFAFVIGLFLGFPGIIIGLYTAFLTGAAISLILIFSGRKKLKGDTIPFGPFLVIGTVFAYLFGNQIISYIF